MPRDKMRKEEEGTSQDTNHQRTDSEKPEKEAKRGTGATEGK